ncbi:protein TRC8 homolog [Planococcus citri]|uniref:protein TRC8 homolog n=1 Tax=Planococcus citri TaxID=170843 RepID=UPI0031F8BE60
MSHLTVRFNTFIESILRVPPIFVLDEIFKSGFSFPFSLWSSEVDMAAKNFTASTMKGGSVDQFFYTTLFLTTLKFLLSFIGCICTFLVAILNIRELIIVYFYLISISMLYFSYQQNVKFVGFVITLDAEMKSPSIEDHVYKELLFSLGAALLRTVIVQCVIGFIYQYLNPMVLKYRWLSKTILISFLFPVILSLLPLPTWVLVHVPFYTMMLPVAVSKYIFWSSVPAMTQYIVSGWRFCRNFVVGFGLPALLETEWSKLHIPVVLRVFWILRLLDHTTSYIMQHDIAKNTTLSFDFNETSILTNYSEHIVVFLPTIMHMVKSLLISGCETFIAVLGMTSVISYICQQIGYFFQYVLLIEDEDKNFGTVSGILFCILALQTGLTGLAPEKRFIRLCRNFCLLFTALLHIIHGILNPLLMSLSASHNPVMHKHIRALVVSAFLIIYPMWLLFYLWKSDSISTWLLAVSAFSIEVIVKMIISLIIYFLFLLDYYRETFWEELDDYVYYIRSFGNSVEFCFGIFLFFNGAWILLYESGSAIRAMMMCIHAYFNIWCEAKSGWSMFMKRRTAVKKIDTLPDARSTDLDSLHDVCSICYQKMRTAKITTCKHFFHAVCLRKWLYLQDYCPICHSILYNQEDSKSR